MLALERRGILLDHLRTNGVATVTELAELLDVSPSTVRRDMATMTTQGMLERVHGGARMIEEQTEPPRVTRRAVNRSQKRAIGLAAAQLVPDRATILVTGGTTTEAMISCLSQHDLTLLTNNVSVAAVLSRQPQIAVVVLGGIMRHEETSLLGTIPEQVCSEFDVDIAFSGASGIDANVGTFGADVTEAGTDRQLLRTAKRIVIVVDSSKFDRRGPAKIVPIGEIDVVVTDDGITAEQADSLRRHGVELIMARGGSDRLDGQTTGP